MQTYIDIGPWITEHWWLAFWLAFWVLVFGYMTLMALLKVPFVLVQRLIRAIVVMACGWPPEHLDADGDYRPLQERPPLEREEISSVGDTEHTARYYRAPVADAETAPS